MARWSPLARAPGALKGGHFRNCQHFCRSSRGFVAKHQKIEGGKIFIFEKNLTVLKKTERGTLRDFQHPFCRETAKKLKGGPFGVKIPEKIVSQCRKKLEGKTGKTFLVQFARPNSAIWCNNIL